MEYELVYFAATRDDTPEYLALTEKQYDAYRAGEPQEGYHVFKYMGSVHLSDAVVENIIRMDEA